MEQHPFEKWIRDHGLAEDNLPANGNGGANGASHTVSDPTKYAVSAYERELETLSLTVEGNRNDQLNRSAYNLGQLIKAGYLDQSTVETGLIQVGHAIGLGTTEVLKTLRSALAAAVARTVDIRVHAGHQTAVEPSAVDLAAVDIDTWLPQDLLPYFNGDVAEELPCVGLTRSDGISIMYAGKEHAVIGEMESGKSWFSLACCLAEIDKENPVIYIHFEESSPLGTVARLKDLGLRKDQLELFHFVGPEQSGSLLAIQKLVNLTPTLVILDGVNEAMGMHRWKINDPDGYAEFRRALIKPFTAIGAATLAADHVVKDQDKRGRTALGSIHKVNALSGVAISLETADPFGRGQTGRSHVYVLKDRPGYLRRHGQSDKLAGKTYIGTMIGKSNDLGEFKGVGMELSFVLPKSKEEEVNESLVGLDADALMVMRAIREVHDRKGECFMQDIYDKTTIRQMEVRNILDVLIENGKCVRSKSGKRTQITPSLLSRDLILGQDAGQREPENAVPTLSQDQEGGDQ